jgi:hypothetical protein
VKAAWEADIWGVLVCAARRDDEGLAVLLDGMDRTQLAWTLNGLAVGMVSLVRAQGAREGYADPDAALVALMREQILHGRLEADGAGG